MKNDSNTKSIFIAGAKITDPNSPFNSKKADILIEDGVITKIGKDLKDPFGSERIEAKNLHASPGFADLHVNVQDPGNEHKEDIDSVLHAAAAGGYTGILSVSSTDPCIDGKSGVQYQLKKASGNLVDLWVSGSISKGQHGKELSEMYDMHVAGAKAFADFKSPVENTQLLKLALLYTKSFGGLIMVHPADAYLGVDAPVNEGVMSTRNGLRGMPSIAEEIAVERAIKLAEYTEQRLHFTAISTREAVDLIAKYKKKGLPITCGVPVANLLFNEEHVADYDSNFKVLPPLRDEKTRKYLIDAVAKGIIDVVITDHWPQNVESKECEFDIADFGMNTLESAFGMVTVAMGDKLKTSDLVELLSINPRKILGLEAPKIDIGQRANITLFRPDEKWQFNVSNSLSLSRNNSVKDELKGRILGVVNNNQARIL